MASRSPSLLKGWSCRSWSRLDRVITFRCTKRVVERFRLEPVEEAPASTGILGDWYANLLNVGSQRFVLCVSERTLLPVILPARRDSFPGRFGEHLRPLLEYL